MAKAKKTRTTTRKTTTDHLVEVGKFAAAAAAGGVIATLATRWVDRRFGKPLASPDEGGEPLEEGEQIVDLNPGQRGPMGGYMPPMGQPALQPIVPQIYFGPWGGGGGFPMGGMGQMQQAFAHQPRAALNPAPSPRQPREEEPTESPYDEHDAELEEILSRYEDLDEDY